MAVAARPSGSCPNPIGLVPFVEPCGFALFSTNWADKAHAKGARTPILGHATLRPSEYK